MAALPVRQGSRFDPKFSDVDGNAIGDPGLAGFALGLGKVASLSIDHSNLRPGERYLVRVHVRKYGSKGGRGECDCVRATAEIFDADSGKTTIFRQLSTDDAPNRAFARAGAVNAQDGERVRLLPEPSP